MKVNDMRLSDRLIMGLSDMVFVKINHENDFVLVGETECVEFDQEEYPTYPHGLNIYKECTALQYINAMGSDWFRPSHEGENPGRISYSAGYLSKFYPIEVSQFVPVKRTASTPNGYIKKYGRTYEVEALMHLPSVVDFDPQITRDHLSYGIYTFNAISRDLGRGITKVNTIYKMYYGWDAREHFASDRNQIRPIVRLKSDCEVIGSNGQYAIEEVDKSNYNSFSKLIGA